MSEGNHIVTYKPWSGTGPFPTSQVGLIDLMKDMSAINSKNLEFTTRDGHVKGVLCDITLRAGREVTGSVVGIPNTWKMRNAFRKFHFLREAMFKKAGVTKREQGKYGQTLRPYADRLHAENGALYYNTGQFNPLDVDGAMNEDGSGDPTTLNMSAINGGEWTRTTLVAAEATAATGSDVDTWTIHVCDEHDSASSPWGSVGMIQAYIQDRMKEITPSSEETIDGPENPLALLASQSVTGGMVADVAEDQEEEAPPYDISDNGDAIRKEQLGLFKLIPYSNDSTNAFGDFTLKNVFLPAGFCFLSFDQTPTTLNAAGLEVQVDVKAIWECRDLA